ncbi:CDP-diacylglycerol--serine O-phosphatidyltransferase [Cryomorphaceae bacterium]|nr:CDP-diacylglycerol--serine O-phosphatidyltransferase [Cryomorphaceae bacterium]
MNWRSAIPNALTMSNLLFGLLSIIYAFHGNFKWAAFCIILGALADLFDGAAARALGVAGPLGVQLDSLADVVTFGVAPGLLLYTLSAELGGANGGTGNWAWDIVPQAPLMIPLFSAFRLAKFNISTDQKTHFLGLPTPAMALASLFIPLYYTYGAGDSLWLSPLLIAVWSVVISLLMVSNIPLMSFKGSGRGWAENKWKYLMLFSMGASLGFFGWTGIPISLLLYLLFSRIHFNRLLKS